MRATAILCTAYILTGMTTAYQRTNQASEWNVNKIRIRVVIPNTFQSTNAMSLIGCVSFCSNLVSMNDSTLYYKQKQKQCTCNSATDEIREDETSQEKTGEDETSEDETREDENEPETVYGILRTFEKVETNLNLNKRTITWPYKHDCASLFEENYTKDGVYVIRPPAGQITDTWCDMTNGGWTVIQRRIDGSENFYRDWNDYVNGFGNKTGEYWIGLETLHRLTKNRSELVVHMEAYSGDKPSSMTAHYSNFTIGDIDSNYTLYINGFNGTCGDSFAYHNGQQFTTFDNDNDQDESTNCAITFKGAFWYKHCLEYNPNGKYYPMGEYSSTHNSGTGIHWDTCWEAQQSSKFVVMKIRRRP